MRTVPDRWHLPRRGCPAALVLIAISMLFAAAFACSRSPSPPPDGQVISGFRKQAWWLPEYGALNREVDRSGGELAVSYLSDPQAQGQTHITLRRGPGEGLTVTVVSPPHNGPSGERPRLTLRDLDLDGIPDEARLPLAARSPGEATTEGGFLKVQDNADSIVFLLQWHITLSQCTDYFLYGKEIDPSKDTYP